MATNPDALLKALRSLPDCGAIRKAMVSLVDMRVSTGAKELGLKTSQLRDLAEKGRALCHKKCHFCGSPAPKQRKVTKKKPFVWSEYVLCTCFAPLRSAYREYLDWHDVPALIARIGKVDDATGLLVQPKTVAYTDDCACGQQIRITVGVIKAAYDRYGAYKQQKKCLACKRKADAEKAQKASKGQKPTLAASIGERTAAKRNGATRAATPEELEIAAAAEAAAR